MMQPGWLYLMLKRLGKRAGIPNLHTHRFRHSYAINALRNGMPERVLQLVGGWRKIPDTYFRDAGGRGCPAVPPPGESWRPAGRAPTARKLGREGGHGKPRGRL